MAAASLLVHDRPNLGATTKVRSGTRSISLKCSALRRLSGRYQVVPANKSGCENLPITRCTGTDIRGVHQDLKTLACNLV